MNSSEINQMMELEFEGVKLRRLRGRDVKEVSKILGDEEVLQYICWERCSTRRGMRKELRDYCKNCDERLAIVQKGKDRCIGVLEVKRDLEKNSMSLGYMLHKEYWNHGIMSMIVKRLVTFAFEVLGVSYLEANHYAGNLASGRVLDKAGFLIDVKAHQQMLVHGKFMEVVYYSLTREEYENGKKETAQ